jgi:hypothetical protein
MPEGRYPVDREGIIIIYSISDVSDSTVSTDSTFSVCATEVGSAKTLKDIINQ